MCLLKLIPWPLTQESVASLERIQDVLEKQYGDALTGLTQELADRPNISREARNSAPKHGVA